MVILDEEQANERSPSKSPTQPLPVPQGVPPPPYAAQSTPNQSRPYVVADAPPAQPTQVLIIHRGHGAVKRFLTAFLVALFVLFLWSIFLDTLRMLTWKPRHGGYSEKQENRFKMEWVMRDWYKYSRNTPTPYPCDTMPLAPPTPGRVLPVQYPPVLRVAPLPVYARPISTVVENESPLLTAYEMS